ncbi:MULTISPECIES: DoxX family protein [Pseudomonas]|jgi:putative oxidoreductase|uniref:DoxX family protein n=1 Tax=Pseudomonas TaxID=286 RepID=UPI0008E8B990|nr:MULTISPECIES: DoxX family protein [Pseudomonas]WGT29528.1 DoxX family protein [Pseudomonas marginalis]SFS27840.1 putative oxidoreductase [Pseudomonas sp. NFACC42-2]
MTLLIPALAPLYRFAEPLAYTLLRAGFGVIMVTHGLPKLLGNAHGSMADPMAASINLIQNRLHLPQAELIGLLVALLEAVGGLLLILGLGTRLVAAMLTVQMLTIAYLLGPTWPWIDRGIEYPVLLALLSLYLVFRGAGRYSLDNALGKEL